MSGWHRSRGLRASSMDRPGLGVLAPTALPLSICGREPPANTHCTGRARPFHGRFACWGHP